ncbi:MAG TPA: DHA2 family efflux MFS transporter permease subunit [Solirubrobacteraceae bacterium]|nr:DHA2 family efflux MFS transporter permease subunit [Solirubrobacteraceae bacterium]
MQAPEHPAPDRADRPAEHREGARPIRRWLALAVLCLPLLIVSLDNTVLNVALPTLVRKLHASTAELQWIVDAYILVFAGLLLVGGSIADRLGRKRIFLIGLLLFGAGSTWAAFSGSVAHLIAARASMGLGGALIIPSTLAIITAIFTDARERQRAFGLWAATNGAGVALGPIVGGALLAHLFWGSIFLINVPIAIGTVFAALRWLPESRSPEHPAPDLAGAALSISALALLLFGIIEAPLDGWDSVLALAAICGGCALIALFSLWERARPAPMLHLELFRDRRFSIPMLSDALAMFGLYGALFVLTQFLQFYLGFSPLGAGLRTLPAAGAILVASPLSAPVVRTFGTRTTVVAGLLAIAGGLYQVSGSSATTGFAEILPGLILLGAGAGLVIPAVVGSVMGSLPEAHTGVGSATNSTFLQVGGALGVAVIGSLLSSRFRARLTSSPRMHELPARLVHEAAGSLGAALRVARQAGPAGPTLANGARAAFISGMDLALAAGAAVAVLAALLSALALPNRPPRKH